MTAFPLPAQIFGLVQTQSKRNLTVFNGLPRNSNLKKLSYVTRYYINLVMLSGLEHPAHIFGLVQIQSKRNLTVQSALQRNSVLNKSSYIQCNSNLQKSSYVDWASPPSPDTWTGCSRRGLRMDCNVTR